MALLVTMPLFRRSMAAEGYLLCTDTPQDSVLEALVNIGVSSLSDGKPLFVPLAEDDLRYISELTKYGLPSQIRPLVPASTGRDTIRLLHDEAFHIAVQGDAPKALNYTDYWLLSQARMDDHKSRAELVSRLRQENYVTAIATGINSWADFENAQRDGFELFMGCFYREPSLPSENSTTPIKANLIRLLNIVRSESYEFSTISNVVRQDTALTVSLMRFINSPYIGVRNRVRSIQQAVTLLGQIQVRKWVTAAIFKSLGTDKPAEITRISLIRAMFAENLAPLFHMERHADSLFLMGLFSILDVILGLRMEQALNLVPVSEEIHDALLRLEGPYAEILHFILHYEAGEWRQLYDQIGSHSLQEDDVTSAYMDALAWYNSLLHSNPM